MHKWFWWEDMKEIDNLGRLSVDGKIILQEENGPDSVDSGHGTPADSCNHNNELSCTINGSLGTISFSVMHLSISP
jgi:hypothetical protein